jgi:hypothetical protein
LERRNRESIFDRRSPFSCQTDEVILCWIKGKKLHQAKLMLPPIGQVIFVDPAFFAAEMEISKLDLIRTVTKPHSSGFPHPIRFVSNEDLVLYGEKFVKR